VGAGGDISLEFELEKRFNGRVRIVEAQRELAEQAEREIEGHPALACMHAALASADGVLRMQRSHDPQSRSLSAVSLYESDSFEEVPARTPSR
jgi:hypothetical protein